MRRVITRYLVIRKAGEVEFLTWSGEWSLRRNLAKWFDTWQKAKNAAVKFDGLVSPAKYHPYEG